MSTKVVRDLLPDEEVVAGKLGHWDVDQDGLLSSQGRTDFNRYGRDGGITLEIMRYRIVERQIIEERYSC